MITNWAMTLLESRVYFISPSQNHPINKEFFAYFRKLFIHLHAISIIILKSSRNIEVIFLMSQKSYLKDPLHFRLTSFASVAKG